MQTHNCCNQNVQLPSLNLLDGAWIHVSHFSQLLLRDTTRHTLPTHVRAESAQFRQFGPGFRHALLGR